jgi:hypothetical protein
MSALLAFLFSFLLFADTPVIADKSVTIDKSAVDKAVTSDKSAIADKSVTADPPLSTELPRIMHFQAPSYPEVAWQEKVHGKVVLKILVYKDGRFGFASDPVGPPALVSAAKQNLCSWTFASNPSDNPLPLTVEYEYRIDKTKTSAQLNTEVTYDLPNHVTVTAPEYSPSCLCVKKKSKWRLF